MAYQIIKQTQTDAKIRDDEGALCGFKPGLYCVYSSVVGAIVSWDLEREDVVQFFVDMARRDAEDRVRDKLEKIDAGLAAYYQFTKPFDLAVQHTLDYDREDDEDEFDDDDEGD